MTDSQTALGSAFGTERSDCIFYEAWRGECGNDAVEFDPPLCPEHNDEACHVCGEQATTQCGHAGQFVCGYPLCETCECANHGVTGHGAPRDELIDDRDIVERATDSDDSRREAIGRVNGEVVRLFKRRGDAFAVIVSTSSGETEREEFDTEDKADEYFDRIVEKYGLDEE